jgi:hypothetical protein
MPPNQSLQRTAGSRPGWQSERLARLSLSLGRSLRKSMKQTLQIFLSVTALALSSCDSSKQDQNPAVDVVVAVWDPSNPVDGAMKGDWDSQNVDVYLDGRAQD